MPIPIPVAPQHLFTLLTEAGSRLAEFDFFPAQQILWVRWFGYLTPPTVIEATQIAVALRRNNAAPRRLLSDESQASGDWTEAMPWMEYHWFPDAVRQGLEAMAFVRPVSPTSAPDYWRLETRRAIAFEVFPTPQSAWHWLARQGDPPG